MGNYRRVFSIKFVYVDNAVAVLESSINAKLDLKDSIVNVNNKLFLKQIKFAHWRNNSTQYQIDGRISIMVKELHWEIRNMSLNNH